MLPAIPEEWQPALYTLALLLIAIPLFKPEQRGARILAITAAIALMVRYLMWRYTETLPTAGITAEFIAGVAFLAVETLATLSTASSLIFLTRTKNRSADATTNTAWLKTLPPPRVDVLICTYNENRAILERTIAGALGMQHSAMRVWVCDDGRREWLRALCLDMGCGYLTRADNLHAKAGNINAAVSQLAGLSEPPDFVMILDADFVTAPHFLARTLPLFRDERVAVVQTPQHFMNPDPIQSNLSIAAVWPDEQRYFFDELLAAKDAWGAAFCCGTSSVIRFSALQAIGGFPVDSVTEDYLLSIRLRQKGWQTIYLNEPLSFGLAPEGIEEYVTQRSRWCLGFMQICRGPSSPFRFGNNLTLVDRVSLVETFLYWTAAHAFRVLGLFIPLLYLFFNVAAVQVNAEDTLNYFAPYFIMLVAVMAWLTGGRVVPILTDISQLLTADQVLRAVCAGLFFPKGQKFRVTAKGGDRGTRSVQWPIFRAALIYGVLTSAGLVYAFVLDADRTLGDNGWVALWWCWYNLVQVAVLAAAAVELPRYRKSERLQSQVRAEVLSGGVWRSFDVLDISLTGVRFAGTLPQREGETIQIRIEGMEMPGFMARASSHAFAAAFAFDQKSLRHLIAVLYSGDRPPNQVVISFAQLVRSLFARVAR